MRILLNQRFGLGNQLFQYAAGLYYAQKYDASLEIIRQTGHTSTSFGHPRPFLLSQFCITAPVRERNLLDRILRSKSSAVALMAAPIRRLSGSCSYDPNFLIIGEFHPTLKIPKETRRLYLNGHFQAYQYAHTIESRLRSEYAFRHPPTGKNLETLQQIRDTPCPVSLHVRLGDYTVEWNGRNLLPITYYRNAIEAITRIHPNTTFFVFSDDIPSARQQLPPLPGAVFIAHNTEATAHEDLRLISHCHHHILANSSFSWWGAWLNPNPDKIVLAPHPWHVVSPHPDIMPLTWRTIPTISPLSSSILISE